MSGSRSSRIHHLAASAVNTRLHRNDAARSRSYLHAADWPASYIACLSFTSRGKIFYATKLWIRCGENAIITVTITVSRLLFFFHLVFSVLFSRLASVSRALRRGALTRSSRLCLTTTSRFMIRDILYPKYYTWTSASLPTYLFICVDRLRQAYTCRRRKTYWIPRL